MHSAGRGPRGRQPTPSAPAPGGSRGGRPPADACEGGCGPLHFSRTAEQSSRSGAHCEAPGRQRRSGGPSGPAPPSGEGNGSRPRGGSGCPGEVAHVGRGSRRLERSPPVPTTSRLPSPKGGDDRGGGGAPKPCAPPGSSSGRGIRACSHVSGSAACTWASSGFPSGWATLCATDGRRASYPNPGPGVKATPCPSAVRIHLPPDRVTRRPARTIRGAGTPPRLRRHLQAGGKGHSHRIPPSSATPRAHRGQPPDTTRGGCGTVARPGQGFFAPPRRKPRLPCSLRAFPSGSGTSIPTAN